MWGQPGFFDIDDRLRRLSDLGDQLEAFRVVLDFEIFRPELDAALAYSDGARGGRPPFDPVMMFKIGETDECRRHRAPIRALRCDASAIRLYRHVGSDR